MGGFLPAGRAACSPAKPTAQLAADRSPRRSVARTAFSSVFRFLFLLFLPSPEDSTFAPTAGVLSPKPELDGTLVVVCCWTVLDGYAIGSLFGVAAFHAQRRLLVSFAGRADCRKFAIGHLPRESH